MRCVVVAMLGLGLAQPALAADIGILRGSTGYDAPRYQNWEGVYFGGQGGVGRGGADFGTDSNALVSNIVRYSWLQGQVDQWSTAGHADTGSAAQYGGFIGYNAQWGDVVVGLEANYNHTNVSASSGGSLGRILVSPDGNWNVPVVVSTTAAISLTDFGTVRARAGYAFDRFLPYLFGGVAIGRASYGTAAQVSYNSADEYAAVTTPTSGKLPSYSASASDGKNNALIYGWTAGFGMDVALTPNIFLRGEYEYIQFSQMRLNLNSARAGIGVKF
jgi:outer membrane immunogenic protein